MDGGAWWAAVHGVAKSWTRLSDFTFTFHFPALEKEIATQCSCLENPRDGGAWWAAVSGVTQSWTRLKRLSSSSSSKPGRAGKEGAARPGAQVSSLRSCPLTQPVSWVLDPWFCDPGLEKTMQPW